ncbi:MAG: DMT family transporter [Pseudomonadota bacterium]
MMSQTVPQRPGLLNWSILCFLGLIWGASFMSIRVALDGAGPLSIAAIRLAIGAAILLLAMRLMGQHLPAFSQRRLWLCILGMGLFTNAVPFTLLGLSIQYVPSAFAGITMAAIPLLVLPLAHLFVAGETLTTHKTVGFIMGFVGVLILIGIGDLFTGDSLILARLGCIAAALCYALGSIITRIAPPSHPIVFSAAGLLVGAAVMVPIAAALEGAPTAITADSLVALIYLGVGPTALATILLVRVIKTAGPSFMSLVNYQVPVWSVIFGVLILSETLPGNFLTALALILAGLALSQSGQKRLGRYPTA